MKDVLNNDMLRGTVNSFDPEISEWGNLVLAIVLFLKRIHSFINMNPANWNILVTGGKERKQSISLVVASEKERTQTRIYSGVVGASYKSYKS